MPNNQITFAVFGQPVPKARAIVTNKRTKQGKKITFTPKRTQYAEADFIRQAAVHAPKIPLSGPIALDVTFYMPIPKSWPKWKKEAAREYKIRPTSTPDRDNLLKLVQDSMNKVFWVDDAQIVEGQTAKYYSDEPKIIVCLEELEWKN
jgi:Holliday junction resolvase RusA-like endonuclease